MVGLRHHAERHKGRIKRKLENNKKNIIFHSYKVFLNMWRITVILAFNKFSYFEIKEKQ